MANVHELIKDETFQGIKELFQEAFQARNNAKYGNNLCEMEKELEKAIEKYTQAVSNFETFIGSVDDEVENGPTYNIEIVKEYNTNEDAAESEEVSVGVAEGGGEEEENQVECISDYYIKVTSSNNVVWNYNAHTRYLVLNGVEEMLPTNVGLSIYLDNIDSRSKLYKVCYLASYLTF